MTPEEVTYLAVLLFSIPLGFAFKGRGPRARQLGGAAVGVGLTLLTCGPHALHSLATATGTWALLHLLPRRCGGAALAWTFGYLLFFRTAELWGLPPPPPYANALQLLLTLKMVSLASDVQELREAGPKAVTSEGEELFGALQGCPGLVEILCYSYCYLGLLTGPFYRFGTHRDWVRGPLPAPRWSRVLGRVRWVPALGVLGEAAGRLFPLQGVRDPRFEERPLAFRLFYMAPVFFAFRMRFYVGWLCAEAACMAAAFGAYPPAACPRPGCGPTRPCPRRPPRRGEEWDFAAVRTVDPLGTERCRRLREGLRCWNMSVQWWLARYVHQRAPRRPRALRSAWTMLASAYWHGLHPGYYLSFLSVPLWLAAERAGEAALGGRQGPWGGVLVRGPHWFLKMRAFDYLCMGFVLLEARATLRYWASVYFCLHLLPLLILLLAPLAGPRAPAGAEREGGGGRPGRRGQGGAPTPGDPEIQEWGDPPAPGDPNLRRRGHPPAPDSQEEGGTPGDPNLRRGHPPAPDSQEERGTPTPGDPELQEWGDPPVPGDPNLRRRGHPPAPDSQEEGGTPGDPNLRRGHPPTPDSWEEGGTPIPRDPELQEWGDPPVPGDPNLRRRGHPPTPDSREEGGTPILGDPNLRRGHPPTPDIQEEGGTPRDPNLRRGHPPVPSIQEEGGTPVPGDPNIQEWGDPPIPRDPKNQEWGDPPIPLDPDPQEGGDPPIPRDPDPQEGGDPPIPRLRSRLKGAGGGD